MSTPCLFPETTAAAGNMNLFAYPGAKGWFVRPLIKHLGKHRLLIEAFAGSAVVGLTALAEGSLGHLVLVEKEKWLSQLWTAVFTDEDLANRVARLPIFLDGPAVAVDTGKRNIKVIAADSENREVVIQAIQDATDPALGFLVKAQCLLVRQSCAAPT